MKTWSALGTGVVLAATLSGQPQGPQRPEFTTNTDAVVVDVVVRDTSGRFVSDLRKDDFLVEENGTRQDVVHMSLVTDGDVGDTPLTASDTADGRPPGTSGGGMTRREPSFVALVFDRLSPEARALSHKGAVEYLKTSRPNDYAGVFLADLSLVTIQGYTNNASAVKRAIDDVCSRATSGFDRFRVGPRAAGDAHPSTPPTAGAESEGPANLADPSHTRTVDPGTTPAMTLVAMARRMERTFEQMQRDQQGHTTTNSLTAVVDGLGQLPGRKTVIFFAESLAIPPNVLPQFQSLVATANRLNVAVYTLDAAGLRAHSGQSETARHVNSTGAGALTRDPERSGKLTEALENNEDVLRRDPAVSLQLLSKGTGGFLINNTNDLANGFKRIDSDRRSYYLLTYVPKDLNFRGEWRPLRIRVPNRRVDVRGRSGYVAVRSNDAFPLLPFEGPALAALDLEQRPLDVPIRTAAFSFANPGASTLALLAAVDGKSITFHAVESGKRYEANFTIVVRVKDSGGRIVYKASQSYRMGGDIGELSHIKSGGVLFFRLPDPLPPGTYALETGVHDALANRAGVTVTTFSVPHARDAELSVGSLVVIERVETIAATEAQPNNPFYVDSLLVYPNLGETIRKATKPITVMWSFRRGKTQDTLTARLELLQKGQILGQVPLTVESLPTDRKVRLLQIPTDSILPGEYSLRLTVSQGSHLEVREASFRLQ